MFVQRKTAVLISVLLTIAALSCHKEMPPPDPGFPGFRKPAHFPEPAYHFDTNPVTEAGFRLGRRLFYEPRLSRNNTISCGSCHIQSSGFTHHGHDLSHGIDDRLGRRNAPPVMNLAWHKEFNHDGGVFDLDLQPLVPITTPEEMDETIQNVVAKLRNTKDYPALFNEAFGSPGISSGRMLKALSQFMVLCISADSKYDRVMAGEAEFTAGEAAGYQVFKTHCASCHQEPLFTDLSYRNNGIGIGFNNDPGRYEVTLRAEDKYKFKVSSLRNLKYTAPYMHDGRFYTLEAVLNKYVHTMRPVENIDPLFRKPDGSYGLELSTADQENLLYFLETLNDDAFLTNPLLAE